MTRSSHKKVHLKNEMELESFNLLFVSAGFSSIGLAYYLQQDCPSKSYTIVDSRQLFGGTWDLFQYPDILLNSKLFTSNYEFKPWEKEKAIADAASILKYIRETASENKIDKKIHYCRKVISKNWQKSIISSLFLIREV